MTLPPFRLLTVIGFLHATSPTLQADTWPQWLGEKRDGIWRETNVIEKFPEDGLKRAWSTPVGAGYNGPTVTEDKVYLMDRGLNPEVAEERILCFDRHTGEVAWVVAYPCVYEDVAYDLGPRAAVTVTNGIAYALGTMGDLHALDAETGSVLWKRNLVTDFDAEVPTWGVSAAPVVEGGRLLMQSGGTSGPSCLALDPKTGNEIWRGPADRMSYSVPVIAPSGPPTVLIWSDGWLRSFALEDGEVTWELEWPKIREFSSRVQAPVFNSEGDSFLLSDFNFGTRRFAREDNSWKEVWQVKGKNERNTEGLHALMASPVWIDDHFYGIDSYGMMRGLRVADSSRVWKTDTVVPLARWSTAFLVRQGEEGNRVWIINELGELILSDLTPEGYHEIDRTQLIEPTQEVRQRDYRTVWSHPAFAHRHIYARNDKELIAICLAADGVNGE